MLSQYVVLIKITPTKPIIWFASLVIKNKNADIFDAFNLNLQEEVVTIVQNKYRKAMTMVEEAESPAEPATRSITVSSARAGSEAKKSMSVTREMVRVVRV